jgi:type I restriction enzyme, S subunit
MELVIEKYKQTEIGLIPSDWEVKSLGKIGECIIGLTYSPNDVKDYGTLVLRSSNVQNNKLAFENNVFVKMELPERVFVKENDILICVRNGSKHLIGKSALIDKKTKGSAFGAFMAIYRTEFSKIVFYNFQSNIIQKQIDENLGATINQITNKNLASYKIPLPPTFEEQTLIATTLTNTDTWITNLEKLLAKKYLIKQGTLQGLLKPKDDWSEKSIIELAENKKELFDDGDWIESEHIINNGVRLIQTGNIGIGKYVEKNNKKYISEKSFLELSCKPLVEGDLLICRLADPAGRACILPNIGEDKVITSVDVTIFRPRNEIANRVFLLYLFSTSEWFQKVTERVGGTTHKRISRSSLGNIKIAIPKDIKEQNRIATILSDMDLEIEQLETKLEKAKKVKQGMMQELLTGKTRLV